MSKSKKKRSLDTTGDTPASTVVVESGIPSTPINNKSSHANSTPPSASASISTTPNNDDPSKWTKSKKKRMRQKRKKQEQKLLMMSSGDDSDGKKLLNDDAINNQNKNSPSKNASIAMEKMSVKSPLSSSTSISSSKSNGGDNDSGSSKKKRHKKNPKMETQSSANTESIDQSTESHGGSSSPKKAEDIIDEENNTNKPPAVANGESSSIPTTPKKKRKKKKKKSSPTTKDSNGKQKESSTKLSVNEKTAIGSSSSSSSNEPNSSKPSPSQQPKLKITLPKSSQMSTLQRTFLERLTSSRFRELNEELYTHSSQHSFEYFTKNPELFDQYHVGFRKQVCEWPVNPVDVIYKKIVSDWRKDRSEKKSKNDGTMPDRKSSKSTGAHTKQQVVVADFGCGDAKLAQRLLSLKIGKDGQTLTQSAASTSSKKKKNSKQATQSSAICPFKVYSFDLVSGGNKLVTPADMSKVPLPNESIDVGVYSLALMGTNVADFVREAYRVLKFNGVLKVADVRSRFETDSTGIERDDNNTMSGGSGGGKRGKLNNGKKFSLLKKKQQQQSGDHTTKPRDDSNGNSTSQQPLMLLDEFIALMERCGFECTQLERSNKMFLFMYFVKVDGSNGLSEKERFTAKPCIYKRR